MDRLSPPVQPSQLERVRGQFGEIPAELIQWFSWHDGIREEPGEEDIFGATLGLMFLSTQNALQAATRFASLFEQYAGEVESQWSDRWFPLLQGDDGALIVVECGNADGSHPLHEVHYDLQVTRDVAPSLTDVVRWWVELHDAGIYRKLPRGWHREFSPELDRYPPLQ